MTPLKAAPAIPTAFSNRIADLALKVVEGDCSLLAFFDDASKEFYPKVFSGNHDRAVVEATVKKLKDLLGEVVERKEALLIHSEKRSGDRPLADLCSAADSILASSEFVRSKKTTAREAFTQKDLQLYSQPYQARIPEYREQDAL